MPYKSESVKIAGTKHDRRRKLSDQDKKDIRENKAGLSQRKLAALYGVSRRSIVFAMYPERRQANYDLRVKNGGSKQYYDKDKHTKSIREHRRYKQELVTSGKIK